MKNAIINIIKLTIALFLAAVAAKFIFHILYLANMEILFHITFGNYGAEYSSNLTGNFADEVIGNLMREAIIKVIVPIIECYLVVKCNYKICVAIHNKSNTKATKKVVRRRTK